MRDSNFPQNYPIPPLNRGVGVISCASSGARDRSAREKPKFKKEKEAKRKNYIPLDA